MMTFDAFAAVFLATLVSVSFAAPSPVGTQFITGPCIADADCASGCCELAQNICRAPLSLTPGVQSCKDGRTPDFNNGPAHFVQIASAGPQATASNQKLPPAASIKSMADMPGKSAAAGSGKPPGAQFITGPCSADADCASGCCERNQKKCRAPLSLTSGKEFCKDGRTNHF